MNVVTISTQPGAGDLETVLHAHWPHMSTGAGWHFASLHGGASKVDAIITWIGPLPPVYDMRFDLMATIRQRLEDAGFRCYDLEYYGKSCVGVRRELVTRTHAA